MYSTPTRAVAAKLRIGCGSGGGGGSGGVGGVAGSGGGGGVEGSADTARPATPAGEFGGGLKADQEAVDQQQQQQQRPAAQQQIKKGPSSGMSPSLLYSMKFTTLR